MHARLLDIVLCLLKPGQLGFLDDGMHARQLDIDDIFRFFVVISE
jgi:hypothetical protein